MTQFLFVQHGGIESVTKSVAFSQTHGAAT